MQIQVFRRSGDRKTYSEHMYFPRNYSKVCKNSSFGKEFDFMVYMKEEVSFGIVHKQYMHVYSHIYLRSV